MTELMNTAKMMEDLNDTVVENNHRSYNGLSAIGTECYRKLQFDHYWAYDNEITSRIERLFNIGHKSEEMMESDLQSLGWGVYNQQLEIVATAGHWKGHIDGMIKGGKHFGLVEMKTHNSKSFKDLDKQKVKRSKPTHYAQMQAYMGYLALDWCLYVAYNKDTSAYYLEKVDFCKETFQELKRKELEIIASSELLPRIGTGKSTWFQCKFCPAADVCYGDEMPSANCRTCKHVDILDKGKWECGLHKYSLSTEDQIFGCHEYSLAPMFKEA